MFVLIIMTYIVTHSYTIIRYNITNTTELPTCFGARSHHPQGIHKERTKYKNNTSVVGLKSLKILNQMGLRIVFGDNTVCVTALHMTSECI